jgi:ABC-2 type transport system ATP-binding protein
MTDYSLMVDRGNAILETAGLTKVFRDFWYRPRVTAVRNLDLRIDPGEVFGLLGPNGSGKSTTIKMILGLLYPTRGRISILGRPPTDVSIKDRIGYLPEESYLYPFLNARETLEYYGQLFQLPRNERRKRIDMLLEMVGLQHEQRRQVGEYSKGMARRIGLAQALINDPEFLILDEPTAGLDPLGTRLIKDLIVNLGQKGKTILLSSHLLADVEDVCDRVSILYGGRERQSGDIRQLLAREELTQITSPRLEAATIERIKTIIRETEQKDVISVSAPSDKLEHLFLDIVRQAQSAEAETYGARVGDGAAPAFLTDLSERSGVIEQLVASADAPAVKEADAVAPEPAPPEPDAAMLESLAADAPEVPAGDGQAEQHKPEEPPAPVPEADRSLIDSLVDNADTQDEES